VQPYKVSVWETIPEPLKDPDGYWYGDYYGVMSFEVNTAVVKNPPLDWPDLLKPDYKGQVALAGDPPTSSQAINAVYAAALASGGSADNAAPGLDFFAKLNSAGNFVPVIAKQGTIAQGETPIVIRWDYLALGDRDSLKGNPAIKVTDSSSGCPGMDIQFDTMTWLPVVSFRLTWRQSFRPLTYMARHYSPRMTSSAPRIQRLAATGTRPSTSTCSNARAGRGLATAVRRRSRRSVLPVRAGVPGHTFSVALHR